MKRGIFAAALLVALAAGATVAQASDYYRRPYVHHQHRPVYPTCRVPAYPGRYSRYPARVQRDYRYGYSAYPYSNYGRVYQPPYYNSQGHIGLHGRNYSLHFGF